MKPKKINSRDKKGFEILKKTKKQFEEIAKTIRNGNPSDEEIKPEQR